MHSKLYEFELEIIQKHSVTEIANISWKLRVPCIFSNARGLMSVSIVTRLMPQSPPGPTRTLWSRAVDLENDCGFGTLLCGLIPTVLLVHMPVGNVLLFTGSGVCEALLVR